MSQDIEPLFNLGWGFCHDPIGGWVTLIVAGWAVGLFCGLLFRGEWR